MQNESYARSAVSRTRGQQGTLEQLDDGRWQARYRLAGRNGKRPQKTFDDKRDAARWLREGLATAEKVAEGDRRPLTLAHAKGRTVADGITAFLNVLDVGDGTRIGIASRVNVFAAAFSDRTMDTLPEPHELEAWRLTIPKGWRQKVFSDTRRMLRTWKRWGWIDTDPTDGIPNPGYRAPEVKPLPWAYALILEQEIDRRFEHVPILACGTGLRPEEWLALERQDVDRQGRVLHVRRVWSFGQLAELGANGSKTHRQRRRVPLRQEVLDRLDAIPRRIDTQLLVPAAQGGHLLLKAFRDRYWRPAFEAAGLPSQRPYDCRHTYAAESIAAGVGLFDLSRWMGTSVDQIDATYGHLVDDSEQRGWEALDRYDEAREGGRGD